MLLIDYDSSDQTAVISGEDLPQLVWADVRRVCEDHGQNVVNAGPRRVVVPWWSFLGFRDSLGYVFRRHRINPQLSESTLQLLREAVERQSAYKSANMTELLTEEQLESRLLHVGFTRRLTSHQSRNVARLLRHHAAATFSVPGAGKTTEALAYFFVRREAVSADVRLVVVAPKNAFAAWEEQIQLCLPETCHTIVRLRGGEDGVATSLAANPTVALISYQQFWRVVPVIAEYLSAHPCFLYLDESHRMKRGYSGVYGTSILRVAHLPAAKLILSGTPMPNGRSDLVPQFSFLYPEMHTEDDNVVERIQRVYVRTTKAELGLRPPIRYQHLVEMRPAQRRLYEALRSETARHLAGLTLRDRMQMRTLGRSLVHLMQAVVDPALLLTTPMAGHPLLEDAIAEGPGPKLVQTCQLARNLAAEGRKCIIWSQFVRVVEALSDMLTDLGAEFIDGSVSTDDDEENTESREAKIRRFHDDPHCMALVANPAACAEGISLHTVCHEAIYVDRNYNAAHYLQSEDRIHRLGLDPETVTRIWLLSCPGSLDDSVTRRLGAKVARMSQVLDDPSLNIEPTDFDEELGFGPGDLEDIRRTLVGGH